MKNAVDRQNDQEEKLRSKADRYKTDRLAATFETSQLQVRLDMAVKKHLQAQALFEAKEADYQTLKQRHDYLKNEVSSFKESVQNNIGQFYTKATENIEELQAKLKDRNSAVNELRIKLDKAEEGAKAADYYHKENEKLLEARTFHQVEYERLRQQLHDEMGRVESLTEKHKKLEKELDGERAVKHESYLQDQAVIDELK